MSLHPVLAEKLSIALSPMQPQTFTRRDAQLPAVPGKAHAVIGMRRAGKTTFLRQLLEEILPKQSSFKDFLVEHEFAVLGKRCLRMNALELKQGADEDQRILLAIEDVT